MFLGHVDSYRGPAVFFDLGSLRPRDSVIVRCSDDRLLTFTITGVREYPKDQFPTLAVYGPTAVPTIRLITCGGSFDYSTRHYESNVVAFGQLSGATT